MRMLLSKGTFRIPVFGSTWLFSSLGFFIFWQFLDGFTTKIGLDLGLAEVGTYSVVVLENYGFWGLMCWKFGIIAAILGMIFATYYYAKRYDPTHLKYVIMILTVGCFIAGLGTILVVGNNISQIELVLHS